MYCRKCGYEIKDENLNCCPSCGSEIITAQVQETDSETQNTSFEPLDNESPNMDSEVICGSSTIIKKRKVNLIILGAIIVAVILGALVLIMSSRNNGTYEDYKWDMTYDEVLEKVEKSGYKNISGATNMISILSDSYFGIDDKIIITFTFDSDDILENVGLVGTISENKDKTDTVNALISSLKKTYGTPSEETSVDILKTSISWKTETSNIDFGVANDLVIIQLEKI